MPLFLSPPHDRHHRRTADDRLIAQGTLLISANFLGALCNAAYHILLGRLLPPAEYAALVAMLGIILVASTPMLALQTTIAHYVSLFRASADDRQIKPFIRRCVAFLAPVALVLALVGVLFCVPLSAIWSGVTPSLFAATAITLGLSLLMYVLYGFFQGIQAFGWLAWLPQLWGSGRVLFALLFVFTLRRTALPAIAAQTLGVGLVLLFGMLGYGAHHLPPLGPHRRKRATGTLPYLLASLVSLAAFALLMNIDANLSVYYFGTESSALLAKAATIARTAVFLPMPLALALFPKVTSTGELPPGAPRLLLRAILYALLLVALAGGVCYAIPALPWTILYGPLSDLPPSDAATAAALVRSMTLAMAPLALAYLLLHFQTAQRRFLGPLLLVPAAALYLLHVRQHLDLGPAAIPRALLLAALLSLASLLLTLLPRLFRRPSPSPSASPAS